MHLGGCPSSATSAAAHCSNRLPGRWSRITWCRPAVASQPHHAEALRLPGTLALQCRRHASRQRHHCLPRPVLFSVLVQSSDRAYTQVRVTLRAAETSICKAYEALPVPCNNIDASTETGINEKRYRHTSGCRVISKRADRASRTSRCSSNAAWPVVTPCNGARFADAHSSQNTWSAALSPNPGSAAQT